MAYIIHRLEQALRWWEDICRLYHMLHRADKTFFRKPQWPDAGPFIHFGEFRKYLLSKKGHVFDYDRFWGPSVVQGRLEACKHVPSSLWAWCHNSRRVFHLTANLQLLLNMTSLDGVTWKEVEFPFKSFAVTLANPIVGPRDTKYDCIVFSHMDSRMAHESGFKADEKVDVLTFLLISNKLAHLQKVPENVWAKIEKAFKAHNADAANHAIEKALTMMLGSEKSLIQTMLWPIEKDEDIKVRCSLDPDQTRYLGSDIDPTFNVQMLYDSCINTLVGLCLYLKSLPSQSSGVSAWLPAPPMSLIETRIVTEGAEVCSVSNITALSTHELETLVGDRELFVSTGTVRPHWRRGYWRRPAGYGHLPDSPRIIWVRPTLVNRSRLPSEGLPGGSQTTI